MQFSSRLRYVTRPEEQSDLVLSDLAIYRRVERTVYERDSRLTETVQSVQRDGIR